MDISFKEKWLFQQVGKFRLSVNVKVRVDFILVNPN